MLIILDGQKVRPTFLQMKLKYYHLLTLEGPSHS